MKVSYPTLVYKCPGDHQRKGGTYSYISANSNDEVKELMENGWRLTLDEAISGEIVNYPDVEEKSNEGREHLENKAKELGIGFNARTTDETLIERIQEALNELD